MKFACDSCGTQYLISDEKVGSRGVKVRCKRCGNVILVRPKVSSDPGSQPMLDGATEPQGRPLDDEQRGDMSEELSDAFDKLLKGEVDLSGGGEEEEEGQETQVLDVSQLRQATGEGGEGIGLDLQEQEKIERVFAEAESTSTSTVTEEEEEEYYVAIDDQQVGPLRLKQVENLWQQGRISEKTLVWHPGLADWKPIRNVPELRYLLGSKPVEEQVADAQPARPAEEQQWDTSGSSSLSALVEEELEAVKSGGEEAKDEQPGFISDEVGLDEEPSEGELPPWEREDVVSGEVARPSDSYFDPSLDTGGTGEIKLGTNRVDIVKPAYLSDETGRKSKHKLLIVGAGAGMAVLLAVVAWFLVAGESETVKEGASSFANRQDGKTTPLEGTQKVASVAGEKTGSPSGGVKTPVANQKEGKGKGQGKQAEKGQGKEEERRKQAAGETAEDTLVVKKTSVKAQPVESKTGRKDVGKPERKPRTRGKGKAVARAKSKARKRSVESSAEKVAKTESSANLPERLDKSQIKAVMVKHVSAMKQCVKLQYERDPSVGGVMKLDFTITGTGRISNVRVTTAEHKGSFVAHCITAIFKKMVFPKFSGPPFTVRGFSLKLGR